MRLETWSGARRIGIGWIEKKQPCGGRGNALSWVERAVIFGDGLLELGAGKGWGKQRIDGFD